MHCSRESLLGALQQKLAVDQSFKAVLLVQLLIWQSVINSVCGLALWASPLGVQCGVGLAKMGLLPSIASNELEPYSCWTWFLSEQFGSNPCFEAGPLGQLAF